MAGKRHLARDVCRRCGGCQAKRLKCRHGHVFCMCVQWVPLVRVPDVVEG